MKPLTCPTCGVTFDAASAPVLPFCSVRCQQIDLRRWMNEEYGLPVEHEQEWETAEEEAR